MEVYEIKPKTMGELNEKEKKEVMLKLKNISGDFNFKDIVEVSYGYDKAGHLKQMSVDPIEGTMKDYFNRMSKMGNVF